MGYVIAAVLLASRWLWSKPVVRWALLGLGLLAIHPAALLLGFCWAFYYLRRKRVVVVAHGRAVDAP